MQPAPLTAELRAAAPGIAQRLAVILLALAALVASGFLKDPRRVGLITPLWTRITRAARRFARAMAHLAAGTAPRPSRPGRGSAGGKPPAPLPSGRAWLVVALRHNAANFASQLNHLLSEPQAAALVAASPQAARILRPLCHILGITPACVPLLPRRRARPKPPAPTPSRPAQAPSRPEPAAPTEWLKTWTPGSRTMGPPPCPRSRWPWVNPFGSKA